MREFIGLPGEVFPFTFFRGPVGPEDMNYPQYALPPWPLPYMHTPFRFFDGLDNDMVGYIFPRGNDAGVPGDHPVKNPTASGTDRFALRALRRLRGRVGQGGRQARRGSGGDPRPARRAGGVEQGRYVLPDGKLSRNPRGHHRHDQVHRGRHHVRGRRAGGGGVGAGPRRDHAGAVDGSVGPPAGDRPDRNTRGYFDSHGHRHWLDVFADIAGHRRASPRRARRGRDAGLGARPPDPLPWTFGRYL